jgi:hypothetical protein
VYKILVWKIERNLPSVNIDVHGYTKRMLKIEGVKVCPGFKRIRISSVLNFL